MLGAKLRMYSLCHKSCDRQLPCTTNLLQATLLQAMLKGGVNSSQRKQACVGCYFTREASLRWLLFYAPL